MAKGRSCGNFMSEDNANNNCLGHHRKNGKDETKELRTLGNDIKRKVTGPKMQLKLYFVFEG